MEHKYYLPDGDAERSTWLSTFATGVGALSAAWNIDPLQITSLHNDANAFKYDLLMIEAAAKFAKGCTANKDELRDGPSAIAVLAFPVFTPPAGAPITVPPGIFLRVPLFVGQLKKNTLCTVAIQTTLGILGEEIVVDYTLMQPTLKLSLSGGFIHVSYVRSHAEGILLYGMRGTETEFTLLATITKTTYNDTRPNQTVGQAEKRQYRAFFMVGDVKVGLESPVFSITC
jgi:hypothetical protein